MSIVKAGAYSLVATASKLLSGLAIIKLVAMYAGPEGVGKLGQFLSLMALVTVFAGGGISNGIVKYVSEYRDSAAQRKYFIQSAFSYTLVTAILTGIVVCIFSERISVLLLGADRYQGLVIALAFGQFLVAGHNLILAIINGFMDIKRVAIINTFGSVLALSVTAIFAYHFQLTGALYATVVGQSALLLASGPAFRRSEWFDRSYFKIRLDPKSWSSLARFSAMTLVSALLAPIVQIWVRNHLAGTFSWEEAGYWQAVAKLSEAYLLCVTTLLAVYFLPRLSGLKGKEELVAELKLAFKLLVPAVIAAALLIYFLRYELIALLFSEQFYSADVLFLPQLVGDVLKIASFVLSYMMLAKAMTKLYIFSELAFSAMYLGWVAVLTEQFGFVGVAYAFVANYVVYLSFNFIVIGRYLRTL